MPIGYLCQWICLTELTHYFYLLLPQFCDLWLLFGKIKALKSDRFKGFCFFGSLSPFGIWQLSARPLPPAGRRRFLKIGRHARSPSLRLFATAAQTGAKRPGSPAAARLRLPWGGNVPPLFTPALSRRSCAPAWPTPQGSAACAHPPAPARHSRPHAAAHGLRAPASHKT